MIHNILRRSHMVNRKAMGKGQLMVLPLIQNNGFSFCKRLDGLLLFEGGLNIPMVTFLLFRKKYYVLWQYAKRWSRQRESRLNILYLWRISFFWFVTTPFPTTPENVYHLRQLKSNTRGKFHLFCLRNWKFNVIWFLMFSVPPSHIYDGFCMLCYLCKGNS